MREEGGRQALALAGRVWGARSSLPQFIPLQLRRVQLPVPLLRAIRRDDHRTDLPILARSCAGAETGRTFSMAHPRTRQADPAFGPIAADRKQSARERPSRAGALVLWRLRTSVGAPREQQGRGPLTRDQPAGAGISGRCPRPISASNDELAGIVPAAGPLTGRTARYCNALVRVARKILANRPRFEIILCSRCPLLDKSDALVVRSASRRFRLD